MKAPVEIRDSLKYVDDLNKAINSLDSVKNKEQIDTIEREVRKYLKKFSADHPTLACYSEIKSIAKQFDDALSGTREKVQRIQQQNERRERYEKRLLRAARSERIARAATQEEKASSEGSGLPEEKTNQSEEAPSEGIGLDGDEANQEEASSEGIGSHDDEAGQEATNSDGAPCSSTMLLFSGRTQQASVEANDEANEKKKREARLAEKDQRLKLELEARLESRRKARLAAKDQRLKLALDKKRDEQRKARHQPKQ